MKLSIDKRAGVAIAGMTAQDLAKAAKLAPSYLSEIENGKKPGSFDAMARLARVLRLAMEDLTPNRQCDAPGR